MAARESTQTRWACPDCGKSMASEGGFKIHVSNNHPGRAQAGDTAPPPAIEDPAPVARRMSRPSRRPASPEIVPEMVPEIVPEMVPEMGMEPEITPEVVLTAAEDPLLSQTRLSARSVSGTWQVTITAEGDGDSVSPALADAFLAALRDAGAQVSTVSESTRTCHYSAEVCVRADGVLTAVLNGISHFQAAARIAKLPAVRIVAINAHAAQSKGSGDNDRYR